MKKFLFITLFAAATGAALLSCNNGDYTATPDGGGGGSTNGSCVCKDPMSARIGGTEWVADNANAQTTSSPLGNTLILSGSNGSYSMVITVPNYTGTKDYAMGGLDASAAFTDIADGNKYYGSTSGTVKFTDDASKYVGTFSFEAKAQDGATKTVAGGYFNVTK